MPSFYPMSDTRWRSSGSSSRRRVGGRGKEPRERIFSDLHPAYRSLRDKSNILSADEATCQEQKDLVKEYDRQLKILFDPHKASEDPEITSIRKARAEVVQEIRKSKCRRSNLIIEFSQAQQAWEMITRPSEAELEVLGALLEQESKEYLEKIEAERPSTKGKTPMYRTYSVDLADPLATSDDPTTTPGDTDHPLSAPATKNRSGKVKSKQQHIAVPARSRILSMQSVDITDLTISREESPPAQSQTRSLTTTTSREPQTPTTPNRMEPQTPTSPISLGKENSASPILSLESMVDKVNVTMRTGRDHLNNVFRSIGNLRQRRRKGESS